MRRKLFYAATAAAGAVVALHTAWIRIQIGGELATTAFSDLITLPIIAVGAAACWRAGRREAGRARRGWLLLGGAIMSWGLGEAVWSYYEIVLRKDVPFPGFADIGYLGMIPLAAAAMLSFPTAPRRVASTARTVVDGLIIGASLLFISWAVVLGPAFHQSSGDLLAQVIGLAYPIADAAMITIVLFVAAKARGGRVPLALIGAGLVSLALADSGFLYLTQTGAYQSGNVIDVAWTAGFLLIMLAALRVSPGSRADENSSEHISRLGTILPYIPFGIAIAVAAVVQIGRGALEPFLFWNALAAVVLVMIRQLLTLIENLSLNRNLEAKVQARTAELERAVRQLAEAQKLQDAFVATISHELRTPLTTMIGSTSTLLHPEFPLSDEARALARIAGNGARRMTRLVEDLLIASGLAEGIACARSPMDAGAELATVVEGYQPNGKTIETRVPQSLWALGDADRFRVVVQHLLTNAEKFAPDGTTIRVDAHGAAGRVEVVVGDEGPGIPPVLRERVFERFYQVDSSDTRLYGGVGLGLYIARRLAEAMGGTLTIDERPRGAGFRLSLPEAERGARAGTESVERPAGADPAPYVQAG